MSELYLAESIVTGVPVVDFDRVVRTVCSPNCHATCGVNAFVKDDRIVKLEPGSYPDAGHERICLRGISMATQRIHHEDRLRFPMIRAGDRGGGKWRTVSWEEAYAYIAKRLVTAADRHGWKANSWISGTGNYGFRAVQSATRVANDLGGSMFSINGLTGDFAGMTAFHSMCGSFCWANDIADASNARYFLSVGRNIADTGHSEMHFLFDGMEKGMKFVVIDPRFSRTAAKADEWVAPRPGSDAALALGMINVIINERLFNEEYLLAHTNAPFLVDRSSRRVLRERDLVRDGSDEALVWDCATDSPVPAAIARRPALRKTVDLVSANGHPIHVWTAFDASWEVWKQFTPEHAASLSEVSAEQIRHVAIEYATNDPAWIWFGLGPQRYHHGHSIARAWVTLTALCGNIGKPYAGISMYDGPMIALVLNAPAHWLQPNGRRAHSLRGTQMVENIATGDPYPIKSLWMVAFGMATQSPLFKRFIKEALPKLDLFVVNEQMMTPAAEYADVVLPSLSYYEDDWDLVGSGEHWHMQLRRRAVPPVGESRGDFDIFKGLCEHLGRGEAWQLDPEEDCREILARHPDPRIRAVDWATLRRDGVARVPVERPYTPFRDMKFNTPSGRIEIYQEQFIDLGEEVLVFKEQVEGNRSEKARIFPFNLITYKHVHTTHSQHLMLPYIREVLPEPLLEISPPDATSRGIESGDWVTVFNDRGKFTVKASVNNTVRPGMLALTQGWWHCAFREGHPSDLGHIPENKAQLRVAETNSPIWDVLCNVCRSETQ